MKEKFPYYVTNLTNIAEQVGDKFVEVTRTEVVWIDTDRAKELKNKGWDVDRKYTDIEQGTAGDVATGSGTGLVTSANVAVDNEYFLALIDAGKALYLSSNTLYIPRDEEIEFPQGMLVTLITNENTSYVNRQYYDDEGNMAVIYGVGTQAEYNSWYLPSYGLYTLLKVGPNLWYLSGPGIGED